MKGTMYSYSKIDTGENESDALYSWSSNQEWGSQLGYEDDGQ